MATEKQQVYKCNVCGIVAEILDAGAGELVCCGEPMQLMEEKTADAANEKHVPVIEKTGEGFKVTVGSTLHPMEDKHYIQWIELLVGDKEYRQELHPGQEPIAVFEVEKQSDAQDVSAREYCNVHGLWRG